MLSVADGLLAPYRQVLMIPGARGFFLPGVVARFPLAMRPIGCVLMVAGLTGSYALAGATSAALTLAQAAMSPRLGRWADQVGQRRVLLPALAVHAVGLVLLILTAQFDAPAWVILVMAALAGASVAPANAMVLARWTHVVRRHERATGERDLVPRAYALENVSTEVFFVLGPFVATLLAIGVFPAAGLIVALILTVVGTVALAARRDTEPPPTEPVAGEGALRVAGLRVILIAFVATSVMFGAVEVGLVAFADERGRPWMTGVLISVFSSGSLIAALAYGARQWSWSAERRFVFTTAWLAMGMIPVALATTFGWIAVAVFVAGVAIAPTVIAGSTLIERLVPPHVLTESFAWYSTAVAAGVAIGASAGGWLIDSRDSQAAFGLALAGVTFALVVVLVGYRRLGGDSMTRS